MLDLSAYRVILASRSPRRHELLKGLNIDFEIRLKDTPEDFDPNMPGRDIAQMLAKRKNLAFTLSELPENFLLITADTLVWLDGQVLNKPANEKEALFMLRSLSGRSHKVFTGVYVRSRAKESGFCAESTVYFRHLTEEEIAFYVREFRPYDKAGAYGVQEWIGYVGIERIEGSYFNVMGLPTQMLYMHLKLF
ncbi:MAG: nucleoside triphosphate pyrophosphatase [Bacteroidales bacterium]|jgi:septum formation protein|nr:nucleoside triphosphate pyrophosphatase [Bacteroidales bacterium]MDN5328722.1 nucleoside triphosphate pyrophosphatase [Bacteroidales bacterium]